MSSLSIAIFSCVLLATVPARRHDKIDEHTKTDYHDTPKLYRNEPIYVPGSDQ